MTTLQITLISIFVTVAVATLMFLLIAMYRNKYIVLKNYKKANKIVRNYNVWLLDNFGLEKFREKRLPRLEMSAKLYSDRVFDLRKWKFKDFFPELADYEHFYNEGRDYESGKRKLNNNGKTG